MKASTLFWKYLNTQRSEKEVPKQLSGSDPTDITICLILYPVVWIKQLRALGI